MPWHPQLDNPDFLGWLVVVAYLGAAVCCGRTASKAGEAGQEKTSSRIWWCLTVLLTFLGINKQLNLQTLMIDIGRRLAFAGGWYQNRRIVQAVFCLFFSAALVGILTFFAAEMKWFVKRNSVAFAGLCVLAFFVILRAWSINSEDRVLGMDLKDKSWAWILEVSGSALIAYAALTIVPRRRLAECQR